MRAPDIRAIATAASWPSSPTAGRDAAAAADSDAGETALRAPSHPAPLCIPQELFRLLFNTITLEKKTIKKLSPTMTELCISGGRKGSKM